MDKSTLAGYPGNDADVKHVIDIFEHDKLGKMPYKTGYVPGWCLLFWVLFVSVIQTEGVICKGNR